MTQILRLCSHIAAVSTSAQRPPKPSLSPNFKKKEKIISAIKSKNKKWVEGEGWINHIPKGNQIRDALEIRRL